MINNKILKEFEEKFDLDKSNSVIIPAIRNVGIDDSSIKDEVLNSHNFVFSDEITTGEITNQKKSGRCWMFSGLNVIRVKTMEKLNVETFEFSESYLQFYDKIEKANSFLEYVDQTKKLPLNDRLVNHIMNMGVEDGGYWNFFVGLINKYGVVPKSVMPETFHSSDTTDLNYVLDLRLKRAAMLIRNAKTKKEADNIKKDALYQVYNICVKALGKPPKSFTYEYRDKDKKFVRLSNITPLEFKEKYVEESVKDKIVLLADPRKDKEVGRLYELEYATSVLEYGASTHLNVPIEELKKAIISSIKEKEPVWFGCDVGRDSDRASGVMDLNLYDYDRTLTELGKFTKEERLLYQSSFLTHAMVFIGVNLDDDSKPLKWKVENSWGKDRGKDGIFSMTDEWFDEHTYEAVVDKKYISPKYLKGLEKEVIKLEYFDPLG